MPRAHQLDQTARTKDFADELSDYGTLSGQLRIPDTAGDLEIKVDLKAKRIQISTTLDAPGDKKARGRIGWLLRQLGDCPDRLEIEAYAKNSRSGTGAALGDARDDAAHLLSAEGKPAHRFRVVARSEMGLTRKAGGKRLSLVESVRTAIEAFYGSVLQNLTAYQQPAPKIRPSEPPVGVDHDEPELATVDLVDPAPPIDDSAPRAAIALPAVSWTTWQEGAL